ncbi:LytTR family transcriptional regulator DNA-binding domain-containing protein [Paenibacillus elgii]|uniref:LytTR family transcriptional regulator DNA-binding domain-containing protein n=1 Tax=Paenibacillus elgii TaxID=189691 RepID=UPI0013D516FC|nr:LytTR family transcriptional regulator DNA-binding domain-containing protein [Paenibacillus elgii]
MIVLSSSGTQQYLDENEITHISIWKRKIFAFSLSGEYMVPTTLQSLLTAYPQFFKVDRSVIVNTCLVKGYIDNKGLYFADDPRRNIAPIKSEGVQELFDYMQAQNFTISTGRIRVLRQDDQVQIIDANDIAYFHIFDREIMAFTAVGEPYNYPVNLDDFYDAFSELGFTWSDRSCIVRLDKVKGYSKERQGLYFTDQVSRESFIANVSKPVRYRKIMSYLKNKN